jgi:hypothetical protein
MDPYYTTGVCCERILICRESIDLYSHTTERSLWSWFHWIVAIIVIVIVDIVITVVAAAAAVVVGCSTIIRLVVTVVEGKMYETLTDQLSAMSWIHVNSVNKHYLNKIWGFHGCDYEECSHLLTLVPRSRIFLPWRWRRYVPPKRRFTQDVHGAISQKTAFFKHYLSSTLDGGECSASRLGRFIPEERGHVSTG